MPVGSAATSFQKKHSEFYFPFFYIKFLSVMKFNYLVKLMCMETDTFIHLHTMGIDRSFHKRLREHGN